MGAYLTNIEMPENCICCDLSHEDGWCPAKQTYTDSYTFKTCPLVTVPPHGDLIEKSAVDKAINDACAECEEMCLEFDGLCADCDNCVLSLVKKALTDAPTIIPADPAEEETCTKN